MADRAPDFRNAPLGDLVGAGRLEPRAARVWLRSARAGPHRVRWWRADAPEDGGTLEVDVGEEGDRTASVRLPGDGPDARPLAPRTRYRARVERADGHVVGETRFETAPEGEADAPDRFAVGLFSCHQPFDAEGRVEPHAERMLRSAAAVLERHEARLVVGMGDQVYSDWPPPLSLLAPDHFRLVAPAGRARLEDCTADEVRRLYHRRYRYFWALPGWRELLARFPLVPILDDHELVDNWGSDPAHSEPRWQAVGRGARLAFLDYQASRLRDPADGLPDDFDATVRYGPLALHVVDLRSSRRATGDERLLSDAQHERLVRTLREHADAPVLGLVLSVPIVHLPRGVAHRMARWTEPGEDFSDRWSSLGHIRCRDRVLRALRDHQRDHPEQVVLLLSGDIHLGALHELRWRGTGRRAWQMITSGLTNRQTPLVRALAVGSILFNRRVVTMEEDTVLDVRLAGGRQRGGNPYGFLNLGLLELSRAPGATGHGAWSVDLSIWGEEGRRVHRVRIPARR